MSTSYDLVLPNNENFKDYFLDEEDKSMSIFPKFSSINVIVGANNSGKSRFMRQLMNTKSIIGLTDLKLIEGLIIEYNQNTKMFNEDVLENFINQNKSLTYRNYMNGRDVMQDKADFFQENKLHSIDENDFKKVIFTIEENKVKLGLLLKKYKVDNDFIRFYDKIVEKDIYEFKTNKKYYIPTLRSAHSLFQIVKDNSNEKSDEHSIYEYEKIEKDIFLHTYYKNYIIDKNVDIFTGLHLYREILNSRNSEKLVRIKFEEFEKFLSVNFFDGKQIDIVAKFDKNDNEKGVNESELILIHVDGDKDTRRLYDLGDGIQALIVLMYKIFMAESNSFIFIDEPELNLHPGMQRLFIEQISSNTVLKKKNLKYIISTHSNHFLDLTIEKENVSIYSFSPRSNDLNDKQFLIKNVNRGDNRILKDLGVNNSSVFMANCSIWVEGISDRNYIKTFLKSYSEHILKNDKKKYFSIKEDIDFAFFEYAGSNIDHYFFEKEIQKEDEEIIIKDIKALALSNRIFLLADSDASKKNTKKGKRLIALEESKTENFIPKVIWNIREIENLITNDMWKVILVDFCNKTLVKSHELEILVKIDQVLSEIDSSNFSKDYVGQFLEKVRNQMGKLRSSYILNQSVYEVKSNKSFGTIVNKRELSELVFNQNFSWEILSKNKEIETLTIEIYNFITQKNN